jgi:hypothetical protein
VSAWTPPLLSEVERESRVRYAWVALLAAEGHVGRAAMALRAAGVLDSPTDDSARKALDRLIAERDGMREWLSDTFPLADRIREGKRQRS